MEALHCWYVECALVTEHPEEISNRQWVLADVRVFLITSGIHPLDVFLQCIVIWLLDWRKVFLLLIIAYEHDETYNTSNYPLLLDGHPQHYPQHFHQKWSHLGQSQTEECWIYPGNEKILSSVIPCNSRKKNGECLLQRASCLSKVICCLLFVSPELSSGRDLVIQMSVWRPPSNVRNFLSGAYLENGMTYLDDIWFVGGARAEGAHGDLDGGQKSSEVKWG